MVTFTCLEFCVVVIADNCSRGTSPACEKIVGIFKTVCNVSHFEDCSPYSKSVSIKFSGLDTLNLLTGSSIASSNPDLWKSVS